MLALTRASSLSRNRPAVSCDGVPLPDDVFERLDASFLRHCRLDAYATGPLLADTPVLQVHARKDSTVPSFTGELLHERLGRPDRYDFVNDHYQLFYFMAGEPGWGKLRRWLDKNVPKPGSAAG